MKIIENYKRAIENSDENLLKEVFAPQLRIEIPAGASLDQPVDIASHIMSQVAKTAPGIKCTLTAEAGNNWYFLRSTTSLSTCVLSRRPRSLRKSSCKDFSLQGEAVRFSRISAMKANPSTNDKMTIARTPRNDGTGLVASASVLPLAWTDYSWNVEISMCRPGLVTQFPPCRLSLWTTEALCRTTTSPALVGMEP